MKTGPTLKTLMSPPGLKAIALTLAVACAVAAANAWAKSGDDRSPGLKRYLVELQDPPLAAYDGGELSAPGPRGPLRLAPTAPESTGEKRLNARSPDALAYLDYLEERHAEFSAELQAVLGRAVETPHRYRYATNGFAVHLSPAEAGRVRAMPLVKSIEPDRVFRLETFAGPPWLGADRLWDGQAGYPDARGEGVVVAVIDTGINWDHPSFGDSPSNGYVFDNPYGSGLGLCSDPEVLCNEKLVGVYDFVEDDPETPDVEEENTKGKDNDGHGSHTASIAAGRALSVSSGGTVKAISGVAPLANIVSYRVCYVGISDPPSDDNAGCQGTAIVAAIDRAVADGVDVINYSIGGDARDPWDPQSADYRAFLNARGAGIFIASSAGNSGPNPGTVSAPALAPWIVAVGNATHNRITGTVVDNFSGGNLPSPGMLVGASLRGGSGKLPIVHARDYGFPLCGTGPAELGRECFDNTGASNPWAGEKPFNGEIVVCDRGTYGRVEKGKNLQLAGAGGYILANADGSLQSIAADSHCLPASHIGKADGDALRTWLASGAGHGAEISAATEVESDAAADQLAFTSSRGPAGEALDKLANLLKPNLIAPGTNILAAYYTNNYAYLSGTSMASPHVAGAAALLKSVHPDWAANELVSALETTATQALAKDDTGDPATTEQVGAGRPQLDLAVNAGLYLPVSWLDFQVSNPATGGDLRTLNLPGLVDAECKSTCTFQRTVTDMKGGGTWTTAAEGFPAGAVVTVTPAQFSLGAGASRNLEIEVDLAGVGVIGEWVSGKVRLSAAGAADQYLTVSVKSFGGQLPAALEIVDDRDSGWQAFELDGLVGLPNATFTAGGLVQRDSRTETLIEDPTHDDPYDGGDGVFTEWYPLPGGALWLYSEIPPSSSADVDLFVGRDDDGDGFADEEEELCSSTSSGNLERCDLTDLAPGNYWILVQNWTGTNTGGDAITLLSAAVKAGAGSGLAASGPGVVDADDAFELRVSWDDLRALPGETWLGAVGVGNRSTTPNNVGVIPVRFTRNGIAPARSFPLIDGRAHGLALAAGGVHDRLFIDVPPGVESLTVRADGASAAQSDGLRIDLTRLAFEDGLAEPPFAASGSGGTVIVSASGGGGTGPVATVSGGLEPGRWYAVLGNAGAQAAAVTLSAEVTADGSMIDPHPGLWEPASRPGIGQGYDFNWGDGDDPAYSMIWYTYDENGLPAWYIAADRRTRGNLWTADLLRATNDGGTQQLARVGSVTVSMIARGDALFSYTLFGESASERMVPIANLSCPDVAGTPSSYTGLWYRGQDGLGGASVVVNAQNQAQIHYLFDADGQPRWLLAAADSAAPTLDLLQFSGFCAVCSPVEPAGPVVAGTLDRSFSGETTGNWTLDYAFAAPLAGTVRRTDPIYKLTHRTVCE